MDHYIWNSFDAKTRFSVLKRLQIAWHSPFKLGKMKTKTTNGDNIREMLSSTGLTTFGENIVADNSPPTSLTKLAGIWVGARDALFQLTLEAMVALWGATNDHDEQGHHQMPQWIPPTLTSSSSFSRFVIRPWSSGNWSANQTTQTLLSCLICCKLKYKAIPDMEHGCGPFTGQKSARPGSNRLLEPMTNYSFLSYSANGQKLNTCFSSLTFLCMLFTTTQKKALHSNT